MADPLPYRRRQTGDGQRRERTAALTPTHLDRLGRRDVVFESGSDSCVEIRRFNPMLAESPSFEAALRSSVETLGVVKHPALASAYVVERDGSDLLLESRVPVGRRVFDVIGPHDGWTFALGVVRDVLSALVALNEADGAVHGALSPDRIVITREGRYVVTEHVLASALESLRLSPADVRALGIIFPDGESPVRFTHWTDLMQLGYVTLSLLLSRPLASEDFPAVVPDYLDEFAEGAGSPDAAQKVRSWLERAMQVKGAAAFSSVTNAQISFDDVCHDVSVQGAESEGALLAFASENDAPVEPREEKKEQKAEIAPPAISIAVPVATPKAPIKPIPNVVATPVAVSTRQPRAGVRASTWLIAAVATLAVAEAAAIGAFWYGRSTSRVDDHQTNAAAPPDLSVAAALPPASWKGSKAAPSPKATPFARARMGRVTVTSGIDLQILRAGVAIGSTGVPFALEDGRYTLDFVNEALGYRVSRPVTVVGGQMTTVKVPIPNGLVSINAIPWAQVTIDGKDIGQTPLANVSLPIGTHEIVFTHPQFGVRTQTVTIKVDSITRVTQDFR
jgi:PEGA domain-containing protein